jgi:hypothetical protein
MPQGLSTLLFLSASVSYSLAESCHNFEMKSLRAADTTGMTNQASPFQVVLRELEESQPVERLDGMAAGTVVVADVGLDDCLTDRRRGF